MIKISPKREAPDVVASLVNSLQHLKNSHALLVGMQCGRATLVVSYKLNIHVAHDTESYFI